MLRRTKAGVQDVIRLPPKQEKTLLCHMTNEQYQIYIDFLNSGFVKDTLSIRGKHGTHRALFALSVLRKLCNHPDLLLLNTGQEPPDFGAVARSGKMMVMEKIVAEWRKDKKKFII